MPTWCVRWFLIASVTASVCFWPCKGDTVTVDAATATRNRTITRITTNNAAEVIIVSNFLPLSLAQSWRDQLLDKWEQVSEDDPNPASSHFLYTTNDQNRKLRSLKHIQERRNQARKRKVTGHFSYGKWELNPTDPLLSEISDFMLNNETTNFVAASLGLHANKEELSTQELSDLFVSHFTPGDFLSAHSDVYSGSYAFVVSLTAGLAEDEWTEKVHGGELALLCSHNAPAVSFPALCHHIPPLFNQLVLFRTRPGPTHSVEAVVPDGYELGFRRLAFTGWYMNVHDSFSENELKQRNEMRGSKDTATNTKSFKSNRAKGRKRKFKKNSASSELR